jgi:hypothetical protein
MTNLIRRAIVIGNESDGQFYLILFHVRIINEDVVNGRTQEEDINML